MIALLSGCYRHHLYVQQEWVDRNFLASTRVGTPDSRQTDPPEGQRLLIAWDFPLSQFQRSLTMLVTVRFWNDKQQTLSFPLDRKRGCTAYFFSKEKILTYLVQVITQDGKIIETWKHHFWTELITVGDSKADASSSSSSVSSQPMQGSVIEHP